MTGDRMTIKVNCLPILKDLG